jgi:hypothetical protein
LKPLGTRDAAANDLSNAFDFSQSVQVSSAPDSALGQDPANPTPASGGNSSGFSGTMLVLIVGALAIAIFAGVVVARRRTKRS